MDQVCIKAAHLAPSAHPAMISIFGTLACLLLAQVTLAASANKTAIAEVCLSTFGPHVPSIHVPFQTTLRMHSLRHDSSSSFQIHG